MPNAIAARDGSTDFSGGVNSVAVTTLASERSPGGLKRNETAWLVNAGCRDGGITQRAGWLRVGKIADGLFQGKFVYKPVGAFPYELWVVSGAILKVDLDTGAVVNLSQQFNLYNHPTQPFAYFVQAEEFCVIQSGDNSTLPLFWDGATLRRSNGLTGVVGGQPGAFYTLNFVNWATIAPVGNTFNCPITVAGPLFGNQGTLGVLGTFEVTNAGALTFQLRTIASDYVGQKIAPATIQPDYPFQVAPTPSPANINEIPAATTMVYYMDRIWYAKERVVTAGDLVFGTSGTAAYGFRDSVLKVTENPLALGGDGFIVPSQDGNIRALQYGASIDAALGQGRLFIFTIKAVYALQVPVSRDAWIAAGEGNQPLMTVVQLANGSVNDRSVVPVNGDLFYQSLEPGIRSLMQSIRYFTQWANTSLSANENQILQFNDRSLLRAASGIFYNNRLLQTSLPRETNQGIVHDAILPLDVLPVSSFDQQRRPNWEGSYEGLPVFQMAVADFGGRERAFGAMLSVDGSLELWELTYSGKFDFADELNDMARRVVWQVDTPAWTWANTIGELELKKLVGAELWVDRLYGTVNFEIEYRPDGATCWIPWIKWKECNAKNTAEIAGLPPGYPVPLGECYRSTLVLPKPPENCAPCGIGRPAYVCYQAQIRLTVKGFARLRGIWVWAEGVERAMYPEKNMVC